MSDISIFKFGGTSVKNVGRIYHVANLIANAPGEKKIVIVSAMGDTTDYLVDLAKRCSTEPDKRELDLLLATGEQTSMVLLTLVLNSIGVRARSLTGQQAGFLTDSTFGSARILGVNRILLAKALEETDVLVIAGFQGATADGEITTLGRGGSDTSAVALAVAAGANLCEIYTDVDGVCTADPQVVSNARVLPELSYEETLELARSGAKVIHPRAVELAFNYDVELRVRNTFNPSLLGTSIKSSAQIDREEKFAGVASSTVDGSNQSRVSLVGRGLSCSNLVARLLSCLRKNGVEVDHLTSSEIRISCLVPAAKADIACRSIHDEFELDRLSNQSVVIEEKEDLEKERQVA